MESVLISIQPKWCELIANGKKTIEVRKTAPKLKTPFKCHIYCTVGKSPKDILTFAQYENGIYQGDYGANGKVIGEFVCDFVEEFDIANAVGVRVKRLSAFAETCLTVTEMRTYAGKAPKLYGWHISELKIYDKPKELGEFRTLCRVPIKYTCSGCGYASTYMERCERPYLTRPPQSWCYVEEL